MRLRYLFALLLAATNADAQMRVTEPDGREKLLYESGQWHYAPGPNMEADTDRPGSDIRAFELWRPDPQMCEAACASDLTCQAWTFVKPALQTVGARCWLKSSVPAPQANACCISGLKGLPAISEAGAPGEPVSEIENSAMDPAALRSQLGQPDAFTKMLVPTEDGQTLALETWRYYGQRIAYVMVDGKPQNLARLGAPPPGRASQAGVDPTLLKLGMSPRDVEAALATTLIDEGESSEDFRVCRAAGLLFVFEAGALVFVDSGPGSDEGAQQ